MEKETTTVIEEDNSYESLKSEKENIEEENIYRKFEKKFKRKPQQKSKKKRKIEEEEILKDCLSKTIDFQNIKGSKFESLVEKVKDDKWEMYTLKSHPGFYFILNHFEPEEQLHWIKNTLEVYPEKPNITNLTKFYGDLEGIFKKSENDKEYEEYLEKLSWCTLGYQYAWTERKYQKEKFVKFPEDIGNLVIEVANKCNYAPYIPEAAIINYYSANQAMGGHLDNAEYEMEKPIVSLSFGNSAIFLLGTETRETEPIPILIRSGDIMVMGGRARYCYHGVAKILEDTIPDYLNNEKDSKYYEYLKTKRINLNVRQVYKVEKLEQ
eukprot:gene11711-4945_t